MVSIVYSKRLCGGRNLLISNNRGRRVERGSAASSRQRAYCHGQEATH
jgi:hypothetical protein